MHRHPFILRFVFVAIGLVVAFGAARIVSIRNLPENRFLRAVAADHAYRSNSDEYGDGDWVVHAHLEQTSFSDLAAILGLTSRTTAPLHNLEPKPVGWHRFSSATWWEPPSQFDELYYEIKPGSQRLLARKGNEIFLQDTSW